MVARLRRDGPSRLRGIQRNDAKALLGEPLDARGERLACLGQPHRDPLGVLAVGEPGVTEVEGEADELQLGLRVARASRGPSGPGRFAAAGRLA